METAHKLWALVFFAALISGCAGLQVERALKTGPEDWLTLGGSAARINRAASTVIPPLHEIWQYDAGSGITASPLVRDSVMIVCTLKGELHAVDVQTGKRIGYISLDGAVTGTPVWNRSWIYAPISNEGQTMEVIDIDDGSVNWRAKVGECESSPLLIDRYMYVTTLNGYLYCLNVVNGDEIWKFATAPEDVRQPIRSSPASDGNVIVFGCDDGNVYAVDRATGKERWKYKTGGSIFGSPIIADSRVLVGSLDGTFYCLDFHTGKELWTHSLKSPMYGSPSANDSLVFVGTSDNHCYALRLADGKLVWTFTANSIINSAPLVSGGVLYVGSLDKNVYALRTQTGEEVWHFETEGRIKVSPVLWNGILLVTSEDRYITAFRR